MPDLKLGKKPARPDAVTFKLAQFVDTAVLPKPPRHFGHEALIGGNWGMLGNDAYGDCVWAGAAHETMMWNAEAGRGVGFNDRAVLSDYSAATGFDPRNPGTDQGTDMQAAASYRRKVGIVDDAGRRHKVAAYLALEPGNVTQLYQAMYLFGAVGIGIEFPASAMDQFNNSKTWTLVRGSQIEGGHYVPLVAKRSHVECVTWGRVQPMTLAFFGTYNDESVAYVSEETIATGGKSPEGFDAAGLLAALRQL
jgi:hypothetical protein